MQATLETLQEAAPAAAAELRRVAAPGQMADGEFAALLAAQGCPPHMPRRDYVGRAVQHLLVGGVAWQAAAFAAVSACALTVRRSRQSSPGVSINSAATTSLQRCKRVQRRSCDGPCSTAPARQLHGLAGCSLHCGEILRHTNVCKRCSLRISQPRPASTTA